jgi:prepilin-type N-terminal cleavage/methylation domain-containing protein
MRKTVWPQNCDAGFTIVELLAALALLTVITGMVLSLYLFVNKQINKRESKALEFENTLTLMHSIGENVRKSKTTVLLKESEWRFLRPNGDTCRYTCENGKLFYNGSLVSMNAKPIVSFSFSCFGEDSLLDLNNDHEVSFDELDLNFDNQLDEDETRNIRRIRATINYTDDPANAIYIEESSKNRF